MGTTVEKLLENISSKELAEWKAYERVVGPLGHERDDYHAAQIAQVLSSMFQNSKSKPSKIEDFKLTFRYQETEG